jgi:hypothetical protein
MKRMIPAALWLLFTGIAYCAAAEADSVPVPDPAAQARAEKVIREVYQKELASPQPAERRALGKKLLEQAGRSSSDSASQYVLLRDARDIASACGDASTAGKAIRQLHDIFGIDTTAMLLASMQTAIRAADAPADCTCAASICAGAADEAIMADNHASAQKLLALAESAAQRARNIVLVNQIQARNRELRAIIVDYQKLSAARQALADNADDPAANLLVGRYLCLVKEDWSAGLPLLAKGTDATLSAPAHWDLQKPLEGGKMMEVADAWWALAERQTGLARRRLRARAAKWYQQALPVVDGLARSAAAKRIDEFEQERLAEMNFKRGLVAELCRGSAFERPVKMRIDPQIDFDWGLAAPDEALPKDGFSIRWTGMLKIDAAGRYDMTIIANAGAKLWIDEKLALDASTATRSRNGVHAVVELPAGLHAIRIDYWDTTGVARMRLLWQPPGAAAKEPVPATAFYHETTAADAR